MTNQKKFNKFIVFFITIFTVIGCAGVNTISEKSGLDVKDSFRKGNMKDSLALLEKIYTTTSTKNKDERTDTTYYLDKSTMQRYLDNVSLDESVKTLKKAEDITKEVENIPKSKPSEKEAEIKRNKQEPSLEVLFEPLPSTGDIQLKMLYRPKDHEQSFMNFTQLVNYAILKNYNFALPEARRIAILEDSIKKENEVMVQNVKDRLKTKGVFDQTKNIPGYPETIIDSPEVAAIENGYSNPASYYLAGFLYESQGDDGEASTAYKRAAKLRGDVGLFTSSLSNLNDKFKEKVKKVDNLSDTLVIVEGGILSDLYTYKQSMPIMLPNGPGKVTYAIPALKENAEFTKIDHISFGSQSIPLVEAANLEYMARRDLKDWMPDYISSASAGVAMQIVMQAAANEAIDSGVQGWGGVALKILASEVLGSAGDEDTRTWKTMPSQIFIGREKLEKGGYSIQIPTAKGVKVLNINITDPYEIIHMRVLRDHIFITNPAYEGIQGTLVSLTSEAIKAPPSSKVSTKETKFLKQKHSNELPMNSFENKKAIAQGKKEIKRLLKLAQHGDADAQCSLGKIYVEGLIVEKDYKEAGRLYRLAAAQGNAKGENGLGVLYQYGLGTEKDYKEAIRLYRLAVAQGNAKAQTNLGSMYANGFGVDQDFKEAFRLYQLPVTQGLADAQLGLGGLYAVGLGVEKDYKEAFRLYQLAANQGLADAQYNLGYMYANGFGVGKDDKEAIRWLRLAAIQGQKNAKTILEHMKVQ